MATQNPRALIISLGGTPAPIIFSLNHQKPEYICFFVSEETEDSINKDILPNLNFEYRHYHWITTQNAEGLSECYRVLAKELPEILKKWEVDPKDLVVDYTGGTKTMSVALALATIASSSSYSYVGGVERSKQGVGVVINGKEKMWYLDNPWDELAVSERKEASLLFNKARYSAAAEIFAKTARRVSQRYKAFFEAMREMAEGYNLWDKFRHREAKAKLYRSSKVIDASAAISDKPEIICLSNTLKENLHFLKELESTQEGKGPLFCYDLMSNAKRRADLEDKFDDAVARLYRAIEAMAQSRLEIQYGIKSSNVKIEEVPDSLKEEYKRKYIDENDKRIKLPLYASYLLLKELGDELGRNFFEHYETEIKPILDLRNKSILAHGFTSIKEETFRKMYSITIKFAGIEEGQIPKFPKLKL